MALLVVRHTDAGDRSRWTGDDRHRPLSGLGRAEADALVGTLSGHPLARVLSSPYVRCLQSVEPLAEARALTVEAADELAEGMPFDRIDRCLRTLAGTDAAVCSHGDVVGAIVEYLRHLGVDVGPEPDWPKGSTWILDAWPHPTRATFVDRPDVG